MMMETLSSYYGLIIVCLVVLVAPYIALTIKCAMKELSEARVSQSDTCPAICGIVCMALIRLALSPMWIVFCYGLPSWYVLLDLQSCGLVLEADTEQTTCSWRATVVFCIFIMLGVCLEYMVFYADLMAQAQEEEEEETPVTEEAATAPRSDATLIDDLVRKWGVFHAATAPRSDATLIDEDLVRKWGVFHAGVVVIYISLLLGASFVQVQTAMLTLEDDEQDAIIVHDSLEKFADGLRLCQQVILGCGLLLCLVSIRFLLCGCLSGMGQKRDIASFYLSCCGAKQRTKQQGDDETDDDKEEQDKEQDAIVIVMMEASSATSTTSSEKCLMSDTTTVLA